jgi:hypothetical protein
MPDLIDVFIVKVKPDKRMEFENSIKKMVDANRKNGGDNWLTYATEYGDQGTYYFTSSRENMASIDAASSAFMKAMTTAFGKAGADKVFADMMAASITTRGQIRRRRPDLSAHPLKDSDDLMKLLGETRWLRTVRVDLKPGKTREFAEAWNPYKLELEKVLPDKFISVSQTTTGTPALYMTIFAKTLADFDRYDAAVVQAMESDAYRSFTQRLGDLASMTTWEIYRIVPELSNVPDRVAAVDPAYWRPKPATPVKPKPKEAAPAKGE